jgi:hypothetical protein
MGRRCRSPCNGPGDPLMMRAGGTPYAHRAQPNQIYRDRNSFPAERCQTSLARKPPLTAGSTGNDAEFVIAVADGGFLRRLRGPHNLARYERPYRQFGCGLLAPWLWRIQRP